MTLRHRNDRNPRWVAPSGGDATPDVVQPSANDFRIGEDGSIRRRQDLPALLLQERGNVEVVVEVVVVTAGEHVAIL